MNSFANHLNHRRREVRGWIHLLRQLALLAVTASPFALTAASLDDHVFVYPNGQAEWASSGDFNGFAGAEENLPAAGSAVGLIQASSEAPTAGLSEPELGTRT